MNPFEILPRSVPRPVDPQSLRDGSATAEAVDANGLPSNADSFGSLLEELGERAASGGQKPQLEELELARAAPKTDAPDAAGAEAANALFAWLQGLLPHSVAQVATAGSESEAQPKDAAAQLWSQDLQQTQEQGPVSSAVAVPKIAVTVQHQETHFKPIVEGNLTGADAKVDGDAQNAIGVVPGVVTKSPATAPKPEHPDRHPLIQGSMPQEAGAKPTEEQNQVAERGPVKEQSFVKPENGPELPKPNAASGTQTGTSGLPQDTLQRMASAVNAEARSMANEAQSNSSASDRVLRTVSVKASDSVLRVLNLQLHPAELGTVTVKMKLAGDQLQMELHTDNEETARLLRHDSEKLSMLLRGSGYRPETISIQVGDPNVQDRSTAPRQSADMQFQGQSFQQGGASQEGYSRNREKQYANTTAELPKDVVEERAMDNRSSGSVYL